jgi:HAD superfamily hydrolase (TIGR01484 family)
VRASAQPLYAALPDGIRPLQENKHSKAETFRMATRCLALDYDGTISPLNVSRSKSGVPNKTRVVLEEISKLIPIVIVTTKDLQFAKARTPFAHAWSAVSGLERGIGNTIQRRRGLERRLKHVSLALEYAKTHMTDVGVEIEEKRDVRQHLIAFCLDWRRAENVKKAIKEANEVGVYCKMSGLELISYAGQPFFDVYPEPVDKGVALKEMLRELRLKSGVLYMGDSEADNPAFEVAGVGLGVIHEENDSQKLVCAYVLKFEDVSTFLSTLLANRLLFSSDFPMIRTNLEKMRQHA